MLAITVHGPADLRVDDVPTPTCGPHDVLLSIEWGGICGSDLAYVRTGTSGTAVLREPLILGHEVSGHIAQIGSAVSPSFGLHTGQRVTAHPATLVPDAPSTAQPAGVAPQGTTDNHPDQPSVPALTDPHSNLWPQVRYFGSAAFLPHENGGFSELRAVRPDQIRVIPEGVSTQQAALAEPFAVALHACHRAGDLGGRTVLVNGAGPIGSLAVASAKALGASTVWAADLSPASLRIAQQMGADRTVNISEGEPLPADVDVAIEASGAPSALGSVIAAVRRGGVLVQVGNLPGGAVQAALGGIVTREIDYRGSYRFVDEISEALDLMASGVDLAPLITHEFPAQEAAEAFRVAGDRSTGSSKVLLHFG